MKGKAAMEAASRPDEPTGLIDVGGGALAVAEETGAAGGVTAGVAGVGLGAGEDAGRTAGRTAGEAGATFWGAARIAGEVAGDVAEDAGAVVGARPAGRLLRSRVADDVPGWACSAPICDGVVAGGVWGEVAGGWG